MVRVCPAAVVTCFSEDWRDMALSSGFTVDPEIFGALVGVPVCLSNDPPDSVRRENGVSWASCHRHGFQVAG